MGLKRRILACLPTSTNRLRRSAARFADRTLGPEVMGRIEAVPGCLNREQGAILYALAARTDASGRVVEIGSFLGRSTLWLAHGVTRAGAGPVIAIDPHDGHERPDVCPDLDSYAAFLNNVRRAGMSDAVEPVRERSRGVAEGWSEPIRLLWIDGSHDYEDVLADLTGFAPHVTPGGTVALHDTRSKRFGGVRRAMLEFFGAHREFTRTAALRNMTVYRRSLGSAR